MAFFGIFGIFKLSIELECKLKSAVFWKWFFFKKGSLSIVQKWGSKFKKIIFNSKSSLKSMILDSHVVLIVVNSLLARWMQSIVVVYSYCFTLILYAELNGKIWNQSQNNKLIRHPNQRPNERKDGELHMICCVSFSQY